MIKNKNLYIIFIVSVIILIIYLNIDSNIDNKLEYQTITYPNISNRHEKIKFNNVNNNSKYDSKCNLQEFKPWTMDINEKLLLKNVIIKILNKINCKYKLNNFITGHSYNSISVITDKQNNKVYEIDLFIYDIEKFIDRRILLKILKNNNGNYILLSIVPLNSQMPNTFKKYKNNPKGFIHKNIEFSNLNKQENNIINNEYLMPSEIRNKWILNKEVCKLSKENKNAWPCIPVAQTWDTFGILNNEKQTDSCYGINTSTTETILTPTFNPTVTGISENVNEYQWLFDKARGIPSFPIGKSTN